MVVRLLTEISYTRRCFPSYLWSQRSSILPVFKHKKNPSPEAPQFLFCQWLSSVHWTTLSGTWCDSSAIDDGYEEDHAEYAQILSFLLDFVMWTNFWKNQLMFVLEVNVEWGVQTFLQHIANQALGCVLFHPFLNIRLNSRELVYNVDLIL